MRRLRHLPRPGWITLGLIIGGAVLPAVSAADSPVAMCVPSAADTAITTPNIDGTCPDGKTKRSLADQDDLARARDRITALETTLAGVTRSTVNGQPTLTIAGENVQIVNGARSTSALNGRGNLILGYNDSPGAQTGSHNILVGTGNTATSFGSLLIGKGNASSNPFEVVLGLANVAEGKFATVTGGEHNLASGSLATVGGGDTNTAQGAWASVSGGESGLASGLFSSVSGGLSAEASGSNSSNLGGNNTDATGTAGTYPAGP